MTGNKIGLINLKFLLAYTYEEIDIFLFYL